jgi:acetyl esterase/lipase
MHLEALPGGFPTPVNHDPPSRSFLPFGPAQDTKCVLKVEIHPDAQKVAEERRRGAHVTVPVLVYWHGGGFIVGYRLYEPWWPDWLLELALSQNALIMAAQL